MPELERWEYWTCFLEADAESERSFLEETLQWKHLPRNAVESLVPALNRYGQEGWELVELRPVVIGGNHDVLAFDPLPRDERTWTPVYLCAFKRRLP